MCFAQKVERNYLSKKNCHVVEVFPKKSHVFNAKSRALNTSRNFKHAEVQEEVEEACSQQLQ